MAYDDRYERQRERGRTGEWRGEEGRGPEWRGDDSFGGGWGNQAPRPHRLGDRNWRGERDDPDYGQERYGGGGTWDENNRGGAPSTAPGSFDVAPGYDAGFGGPRFDRVDVGSVGTHGVHPVSSPIQGDYSGPFGVMPGGGYRSSARRYAELQRHGGAGGTGGQRPHDPHYAEWRSRQLEQLDRDYDEYCQEHQSRFDQEFGAWRERRSQQRQAVGRVTEHMEVVGSDGSHVGTVDGTSGDRIVLTKNDPNAGGHHHAIPCSWVDSVDDKVRLNITAEEAIQRWRDAERSNAFFDRDREEGRGGGQGGPHILDRSFAGTYRDRDDDR